MAAFFYVLNRSGEETDRMKEIISSSSVLPCLLNLANPVNPVYFFVANFSHFFQRPDVHADLFGLVEQWLTLGCGQAVRFDHGGVEG